MVLEGHIFSVSSVLHEVWSIACAWNYCSRLFLVKYTDYQLSMIDVFVAQMYECKLYAILMFLTCLVTSLQV